MAQNIVKNITLTRILPLICISIIAKLSTFLLAGALVGYISYISKKRNTDKENTTMSSSLQYKNQPHYASVHHDFYNQKNIQTTQNEAPLNNMLDITEKLVKKPHNTDTITLKDDKEMDTVDTSIMDCRAIEKDKILENEASSDSSIESLPMYESQELIRVQSVNATLLVHPLNDIGRHPLDTTCDILIEDQSMDFEHLLRFPACPTTLPRLDTQFNFKIDHHHEMKPDDVDWLAIHKELEYERQRIEQEDKDDDNELVFLPSSSASSSTTLEVSPFYDEVLLTPPKPSISTQAFKNKFQQAVNRMKKKKTDPIPKPSTSTLIKGKLNRLFTGNNKKTAF